jgi:hypothetical protein
MSDKPRVFAEREAVDDMQPCMKKFLVVHCKKMNEPFRVQTMEGDYKLGKTGDYLMRGPDGELYIHDGFLFGQNYVLFPPNSNPSGTNFWPSFEMYCVCRDLSYEQYTQMFEEHKFSSGVLSRKSYGLMAQILNTEIEENARRQNSEGVPEDRVLPELSFPKGGHNRSAA